MTAAIARVGKLSWEETGGKTVRAKPERFGDVVLARKDMPTSYHLSVSVDDHLQSVTLITRGVDLAPSTDVHRLCRGYSAMRRRFIVIMR